MCSATQLCLTLCSSTRLLCPWNFPDNNTGVDCHFLFQGIFPTQDRTRVSCMQAFPSEPSGKPLIYSSIKNNKYLRINLTREAIFSYRRYLLSPALADRLFTTSATWEANVRLYLHEVFKLTKITKTGNRMVIIRSWKEEAMRSVFNEYRISTMQDKGILAICSCFYS